MSDDPAHSRIIVFDDGGFRVSFPDRWHFDLEPLSSHRFWMRCFNRGQLTDFGYATHIAERLYRIVPNANIADHARVHLSDADIALLTFLADEVGAP